MDNKIVDLPSGAKLEICPAPFAAARALCDAIMEEGEILTVDPQAEVDVNFIKNIFFRGMTSKKIDKALAECTKRCTYNGLAVKDDLFEPIDARQDFYIVKIEIASENVRPFTKSLYAQFAGMLQKLATIQA